MNYIFATNGLDGSWMRIIQRTTKAGNEIEISSWIDWSSWAFPLQIQWRFLGHKRKIPKGHLQSLKYVSVQFLCFVATYDFWVWGVEDIRNDDRS